MTIRFAAAAARDYSSVIARSVCAPVPNSPANDNGHAPGDERLLWEALRHFGRHGLDAARRAVDAAETALDAGDREGFEWWLSICCMLDRQMGETLARQAASAS